MEEIVLAGAVRTAIGKFQGALSKFAAPQLGAIVVREAVRRAGLRPSDVQEVILGQVLQAGAGQNPARQAARGAGIPDAVGSTTINKVCGSGLKAVVLAAQAIKAGDIDVAVAGGQESMTNAPYLLPDARAGLRLGHGKIVDAMVHDGLWDVYNNFHMGNTAELAARKHDVTRQAQDEYAARSHARAVAAIKAGRFKAEIVKVEVPQPKGAAVAFETDEGPREDSTVEKLAKLRPAFQEDGTVTAANASSINDGASAVVVLSATKAKALGVRPMARITGYATGGLAPEWVMMAPVEAVRNLAARTGLQPQDFDLIEINEAFSAASVAVGRELKLDPERVNVNGGAVALGHPIGASGARILTTLLYALQDRGQKKGLAALCLGGGNAVAMSVELV
ncbi:MAG: acetyl-CoA C-acetyltransferase [Planctomycetes bacterium]|nr:acetyl-CoA C-acetyltransferase [Planctomycetota bacterium]